MNIERLTTPSFLVDLDKMEGNIKATAELCKNNGKILCPMVKTHKSAQIAKLQKASGAAGFLTGTLDEAEMLVWHGFQDIVLAYPVAAAENIARVVALNQKANITVSFDGLEAALQMQDLLKGTTRKIDYLIIIDCGLHRFGVKPDQAVTLVKALSGLPALQFKGIATHPGHVYGSLNQTDIERVAKEEIAALETAQALLAAAGFEAETVATGSTPTLSYAAQNRTITTLRPGNYVFYDAIQVSLGTVPVDRCALTVLATIIAHPGEDIFIMDAGSKCLGLDKGAHSTSLVNSYGIVKNHPELAVEGLSEEVGKLRATKPANIKVGDKIEIIPNHACAAVNMSSYLLGHRQGKVERIIEVDARGGTNQRLHTWCKA